MEKVDSVPFFLFQPFYSTKANFLKIKSAENCRFLLPFVTNSKEYEMIPFRRKLIHFLGQKTHKNSSTELKIPVLNYSYNIFPYSKMQLVVSTFKHAP